VSDRFTEMFPALHQASGDHNLPSGASEADIKAVEQTLKIGLPSSYREFLLLSDGPKLFSGRLQFWSTTQLVERTRKMWGGWYDERHIFFAECAGRPEDSDWFHEYDIFFDYQRVESGEPTIGFFNAHPTDCGSTGLEFSAWLALAVHQQGFGLPPRIAVD
jgi:hypothetical protein